MVFPFFKKNPDQIESDQLYETVGHCRKRLRQDCDLLSSRQEQAFRHEIQKAQNALTANAPNPGQACERLIAAYERCFSSIERSDWVESFFVALVIAMAVRAFFLQPFKIPTGSMQPTLNGITVHARQPDEKTWWYRFVALPIFGQDLIYIVADSDGKLEEIQTVRLGWLQKAGRNGYFNIFPKEAVKLQVGRHSFVVPISRRVFENDVRDDSKPGGALLRLGQSFKKGDVILNCVLQTGDYLFVDRFTYNFRKPRRGDVFVFETDDLAVSSPGEFYIKRIAGVPGDTLQIKDPDLYVNGKKLSEPIGFVRVMSRENGHRGYTTRLPDMHHLNGPDQIFPCGDRDYFALGDNSFSSQDSRFWGPVPYKNIVGRGFFVHWPFTRHFGRVE